MDNSELEEIIYLETSIININHKIQDLNSTLIEKEIIIQELSNHADTVDSYVVSSLQESA